MNSGYKICPKCGGAVPVQLDTCPGCGCVFVPISAGYVAPPPIAGNMQVSDAELAEKARRFMDSRKLCIVTFFIGLFCLYPVWIVTYLEYDKMRMIKDELAHRGVDVRNWQLAYGCRDVI